ncbi:enoyl-CoA hydratase/carnithine racemase [Bradyrhizobium sp. LB14.3]|uniref:enoyl-CoA hydratase-related protein n=1 Tax=Bradyrhizobium sp. LB14.3 TaxID=3156328 RepID=UPI003391F2A4
MSPGATSNAIDDLPRAIIETTDRLVVSVVRGNAGAGGVFLSLAADEVWARDRTVLNRHYKDMGNLYGSEYWTYLLPLRAGAANAAMITQCRLPMGVAEAGRLGIVDRVLTARGAATDDLVKLAAALASDPTMPRASSTSEGAAPLTKPRSRSTRTATRSCAACGSTSTASIQATTWRVTISFTRPRSRVRR